MAPTDGLEPDLARLRAALVRAVARVCPPWLADCADDLVQQALLRVDKAQRRSEGKAELSSFYLGKVAYSVVVDEIRRRRRRQEVPLDEDPAIHKPAPQPDPFRICAGGEIGQAIRDCLGQLVRPRRLAVTLHLQGHQGGEVAQLLGWSAKKTENLIYRGLGDLRGCLETKGIRP